MLSGIPVAHRPKIWAEMQWCFGDAYPGFYDDLVNMVNALTSDPTVVTQIDMDITARFYCNVFFRNGPGVAKLRDVLLAYSAVTSESDIVGRV